MKTSLRRLKSHSRRIKYWSIPIALSVFLVFGGSSHQNPKAIAGLMMLSSFLCATALVNWRNQRSTKNLFWLFGLLGAAAGVALLQMVPLPTWWLATLPMRMDLYADWELLGVHENYTALSLAPERTFSAVMSMLIPCSAILIVYQLGWSKSTERLPWIIVLCGAASVTLGLSQVLVGEEASLYLYDFTSDGRPVGFFANVNHQASFVLMTIPFTAYLIHEGTELRMSRDTQAARTIALAAIFLLQVIGILAAGSVAGYILLIPVVGCSYVVAFGKNKSIQIRSTLTIITLILVSGVIVASSPILENLGHTNLSDGEGSRISIYKKSLIIWRDNFFFGTGLGTFEPIYKIYEHPDDVTLTYIHLAHNEYLQLAIELGVIGLFIMVTSLYIIGKLVLNIWANQTSDTTRLRRSVSISLLVPLLHSLVDYPARTPSILFFIGICVALLAIGRSRSVSNTKTNEPAHTTQSL